MKYQKALQRETHTEIEKIDKNYLQSITTNSTY